MWLAGADTICARSSSAIYALYTTLLTIPIALTLVGGQSEVQVGFVLLFMTATMVLFTPVGGRLADKIGRRWPVVAGMALMTTGFVILTIGQTSSIVPLLLIGLGVAGTGLGIASPGQQTAALESVTRSESGTAAGVYSTPRYLSSITGASLLAALLAGSGEQGPDFMPIFILIVGAAFVAMLFSHRLEDHPTVAITPASSRSPAKVRRRP